MMRGAATAAVVLAAPTVLGGCIAAAVVPIAVSSSAIVKSRMDGKREDRQAQRSQQAPAATVPRPVGAETASIVSPSPVPAAAVATPSRRSTVPDAMQYLYGSGESAAGSVQAYRALQRYLADWKAYGKPGKARQVVLSDSSTLDAPQFEPCGPKPPAIILDIDETALLNIGYEGDAAQRGEAYDEARWKRWEESGATKVVAVPGVKAALDAARAAGIAVIFNSNRSRESAAQTEAALNHAGLGPAKHGSTLWLKGDDGGGSGKDDRRWAVASGYCVIAMVGDQLGDFSDLFNDATLSPGARRTLVSSPALAGLWGAGWFVLPNPVYGTALKGGYDDVFPPATRWSDPGTGAVVPATAQQK